MHEKCLKKCIKLIVPEIVLKIGNNSFLNIFKDFPTFIL